MYAFLLTTCDVDCDFEDDSANEFYDAAANGGGDFDMDNESGSGKEKDCE